MPKFVKIQLNAANDNSQVWKLVIENEADLFTYAKKDNQLNSSAYFNQDLDTHPRGRAANMNTLLAVSTLHKTGLINPMTELNGLFKLKMEGMLRMLDTGQAICVNYEGGYCGFEGFLESYNATILETIEKSDFGFPIDQEIVNAEVIVLENDQKHISSRIKEYLKEIGINDFKVLLSLKELDQSFVFKAIQNAHTIALHSQFNDPEQVNTFMAAFANVFKGKRLILSTYHTNKGNGFDLLKSHYLFEKCAERHNIIFIK